jgi:hypothetical protein
MQRKCVTFKLFVCSQRNPCYKQEKDIESDRVGVFRILRKLRGFISELRASEVVKFGRKIRSVCFRNIVDAGG